jgi:8-oxo-dGTP diphosphatase
MLIWPSQPRCTEICATPDGAARNYSIEGDRRDKSVREAEMRFDEQGTIDNTRYTVVPRTLSFLVSGEELLLLRGAATKRLWANRLNGLGGHLEPGEDPRSGALREIREEAGLEPADLALRALVHVTGQGGSPGVLLFVYVGHVAGRATQHSDEGSLEWHPLGALPWSEMVEDLPQLLPQLFHVSPEGLIYGIYDVASDGTMAYHWRTEQREPWR